MDWRLGDGLGWVAIPGTKLDIEVIGIAADTKYESMRDEIPIEMYQPARKWISCWALGLTSAPHAIRNRPSPELETW
jgi:hypothetical protein